MLSLKIEGSHVARTREWPLGAEDPPVSKGLNSPININELGRGL